ncbi:MAG: gliding motility protein GldC [Flavobacteriaceae bacterium]
MAIHKQTPITIDVGLDENKLPEKIEWSAPDGGISKAAAKAMLLSLWDGDKQETLRMDLWVKDMPVDQMQRFFHQSLVTMGETYYRATQDEKMAQGFEDFAAFFAEKLKLR